MRRLPKSRLPLQAPHRRALLPLLHLPPFAPAYPSPRLLLFFSQTLTAGTSPDAAPTAEPVGLAFPEETEFHESACDHQQVLALTLKALIPLQESHGKWSLTVARALRLAGAAASRTGRISDRLESLGATAEIVDYLRGTRRGDRVVGAVMSEQLAHAKTTAGRWWDAVGFLRRALKLKAGGREGGFWGHLKGRRGGLCDLGTSEIQYIAGSISERMWWLLLLSRRARDSVPYLESAVDKLKNCFGPKNLWLRFCL